ncbi:MAG: TolC family protein [Acidobacteria bacterium]|nr:TolC family protein [Acidobacteriota bacterium]
MKHRPGAFSREWLWVHLIRFSLLIFGAVGSFTPAATPTVPPQTTDLIGPSSTLADLLAHAAVRNAEIRAVMAEIEALRARVPQAEALPDPMLTYAYFPRSVETRVGPQRQRLAVSQKFFWPGKRDLRAAAAREDVRAAKERLNGVRTALAFRIKQAWYEYAYLNRALAVTRDNIQLVTRLEATARSRYSAGQATYADILKAQVTLARLEDQWLTLTDMAAPLRARLNTELNRPVTAPLPVPQAIDAPDVSLNAEDLLTRLHGRNPELREIRRHQAGQEFNRELARRENRPDFTIGVDYLDMGGARMDGVPDSGKNALGVSVSLNIPLWRDKYDAAREEATRRTLQLRERETGQANRLTAELNMALYEYRNARRRHHLYGETLIPKADQALAASEKAFATGRSDFNALLEAQQTLLAYTLEMERSRADQAVQLARLEMLVGEELLPGAGPAAADPADNQAGATTAFPQSTEVRR